jgi:predicted RNase H-like nuclease (RuvC/YqgF family)
MPNSDNTQIYDALLSIKEEIGELRGETRATRRKMDEHFRKLNSELSSQDKRVDKLENNQSKAVGMMVAIGTVVTVIGNAALWFWRSVTNAN